MNVFGYLQGQRQVRFYAIGLFVLEAVTLFERWARGSRSLGPSSLVGLALTAGLMFWMSRGSNVARWIAVTLWTLSSVATAMLMAVKQVFLPELVVQLAAQAYVVWKLARDPDVRTYFRGLPSEPNAASDAPANSD